MALFGGISILKYNILLRIEIAGTTKNRPFALLSRASLTANQKQPQSATLVDGQKLVKRIADGKTLEVQTELYKTWEDRSINVWGNFS